MENELNYNEKSKFYAYLADVLETLEKELESKKDELSKAYDEHFRILDEVEDTKNSFEFQYSKRKVNNLEAECLALNTLINKIHETF